MSVLKLSIYSLKGNLYNAEADIVVVPGINGDIGVISGERILTYIIKPGILYLIKDDKTFKRFFIFSGRFLAQNNEITITTEYELIDVDNITRDEIVNRIKLLEDKVNKSNNEADKDYYKLRLQQENILLTVYKDKYY